MRFKCLVAHLEGEAKELGSETGDIVVTENCRLSSPYVWILTRAVYVTPANAAHCGNCDIVFCFLHHGDQADTASGCCPLAAKTLHDGLLVKQ